MQKLTILFLLGVIFANASARSNAIFEKNKRSHNGFHFEVAISPIYGKMTEQFEQTRLVTGKGFEIKVGCGLNERWLISFDVLRNYLYVSPRKVINTQGISYVIENGYLMTEGAYGPSLTYYSLPRDIVLSATVGWGAFKFPFNYFPPYFIGGITNFGYMGQVKIGKHWWVSDNLGFSLALIGGFISVTNSIDDPYKMLVSVQRVSLLAAFAFR